MFKRVLIANRGEIAIRIARAAAALGMESVSVYAPADALSLHTRVTDKTVALAAPDGDPVRGYLDGEALVRIARENGCDCVHPGYGFLSENADFARRCAEAGIAFVGPSAETLALFGDKTKARTLAQSLSIPVIEGTAALADAGAARAEAARIGYPVMLKAAAGGGGRGMRAVTREGDLETTFALCRSEAQAAFGDGAVYLEKLIERPRHIEVQIAADSYGEAVHLHERDCSVQQRNQKVVEIAPAPNLPPELRASLHRDAIKLVQAAKYANIGTVEFLVSPERGAYVFIECNPRVQVEHTITEEATGIDLVETQFRIAAGETLRAIGLSEAPPLRGHAVQARIVATAAGALTGYKEPSGPGVRVDSCGYPGYAPPPQFDPMFAKLIAFAPHSLEAAVKRTLRALDEFYIAGLPTNIALLRAILRAPSVAAGDARTTLLNELAPDAASAASPVQQLLAAQAGPARAGARAPAPARMGPSLAVPAGEDGVECPMSGALVSIAVKAGASVRAGETSATVSAMKMETAIAAPVTGIVSALAALSEGESVSAGQIIAVVKPAKRAAGAKPVEYGDDSWAPMMAEVKALQDIALKRLAPGSSDPGVVRQRARGKLTCRERIDLLLDSGTFREVGSLAGFASYDEQGRVADFTPANHVGGWGKIEGRQAIVCADDFTSRGGHSDGSIGAKNRYLDELSLEFRCPSIRLLDGSSGGGSVASMVPAQQREGEAGVQESTGAIKSGRPRVTGGGGSFLVPHLGSAMYARQLSEVPVINMLLGSVVGIGAAKAVLGHFSVMVRDVSQLFVAGPPVVSHAVGYDVTKEELGGWHIHCCNGSVDNLAESEEEAAAMAKRFLSFLPSSVFEAPPIQRIGDPIDRREEELFTIVPRKRTTTFDMRRAIRLMADRDSFFEIGPLWGTDQIVGFVRFNGYPMGVLASDSRHENGGAMTADGCDKLKRHIDLCDLFHIPILNLIDNPGFAVGVEHETAATIRKGGEWMIAFAQASVPIFTVIMRRSFGVAGNNFATPVGHASARVIWPAADVGGIPPEGGIEAAYKRQLAEAADPAALRAEINARIESARGPVGPLNRFQMEEMIDPRETRRWVCEWVENAFRVATMPGRLAPRGLGFRP